MAKALRKIKKKVRKEQADIQAAGKKRGLFSKIGSTLIGGLAVLATGGAASPFVAAMMAGGGSALGGHLGNLIAGKTKGGKLKGGRFFQGERADLGSQIKEGITAGALQSGLYAGLGQVGGLKGLLGGGKEVAAGGQKLSIGEKIFKGGAGKQPEGFGKLFDFRGSAIGKKVGQKLHEGGWVGYELEKMGEGAIGTTKSIAEGVGQKTIPQEYMGPGGSNIISPRVRTPIATEDIAGRVTRASQRSRIPTDIAEFTTQMPSIPEEQIGGVDPLGLRRMRVAENVPVPEFTTQRPIAEDMLDLGVRTPTSYGPGIDETRMSVEDWKSAIPSDAGSITPSEFRRPSTGFTPEMIDVPKRSPLITKQGLKSGIENYFAPGEVYEGMDVLSYPSGGAQGPPEKLGREMVRHAGYGSKPPQWWNRLFGEE